MYAKKNLMSVFQISIIFSRFIHIELVTHTNTYQSEITHST